MSSRVRPGDASGVARLHLRSVRGGAAEARGAPDSAGKAARDPAPPDGAAQLAEMERRCAQKVAEARAAGMREGEEAGRKRAASEMQAAIDRLARSVEDLARLRPRLRREAEEDVVRLSLAIARRILRREAAVDPDAMRGLVLAALGKLESRELSRVRVHPSHAALVSGCLRDHATGCAVEVVSDPSREPGAVIFETERGDLDASVGTQLEEIERGLADRLRRQS